MGGLLGLISGGVSVLGDLLGFGSQERANKANMELAKYQYEKNLEMWNRQNEYNTPLAQRKRLIEAGLNPGLMYGNGTVANTASDAPKYEAPQIKAYNKFSNAAMDALSTMQMSANVTKTYEEASSIRTSQLLTQEEIKYRQIQQLGAILANEKLAKEMPFVTEMAQQSLNKLVAEVGWTSEKANTEVFAGEKASAEATTANIQSQTAAKLQPILVENEKKRGRNIDASTGAYNASAAASAASARLSDSQAALNAKKIEELNVTIKDNHEISELNKRKLVNEANKAAAEYDNLVKDGKIKTQQEKNLYWDAKIKEWDYIIGKNYGIARDILRILKQ